MKRCPKCEFTFDDHQGFCDFDGAELSVVPQLGTSLKDVSLPATESPSPFQRAVRSPVTVASILLVVVTLSALMIGYYDAANSPDSVSASNLEHGEQVEINSSSQGPSYVSMERRVTSAKEASAMPSSTLEWLAEESESEPSPSRADPPTSKPPALLPTNPRRPLRFKRQSVAVNQRSVTKPLNRVAHRALNRDATGKRQKDSKVVAILKKTGSILTWPFKL
ncbi:MAG TPA: hypothetical protein VEW46_12925 [Pyrinomonadaceae bacterium]|nr:hypothetical protein [Pyrinomonadaceae bacterium]